MRCRRGKLPIVVLVLTAVFFMPSSTMLNMAALKGIVPASVAGSWWWQGIIMPHQVYALTAMAVLLVIAAWRERRGDQLVSATVGG